MCSASAGVNPARRGTRTSRPWMAKRMASRAEAKKTSSSTRLRKKYLTSLRSNLVCLRVTSVAERRNSSAIDWRYLLFALACGDECLVFSRGVGDHGTHEVNPDGQRGVAAGFVVAKIFLFVKADPDTARHAGCEADKPCVRIVIGCAGLARHRMTQLAGNASGAVLDHLFQQ